MPCEIRIHPTKETGCDSGRPRYRVVCLIEETRR